MKVTPSATIVIGTFPLAEVMEEVTAKVICVSVPKVPTLDVIPVGFVPTVIEVGVNSVAPLYMKTLVVIVPATAEFVVPAKTYEPFSSRTV